MSALQFLNKKSWHTGTIRSNEKVWLREQAAAKEEQRVAELQKQIEEERREEEIRRLEVESGRLDPAELKKRKRIEWMYETPAVAGEEGKKKEQEETLLGRKAAGLPDTAPEARAERFALVDAENKLREDPLLEIERERRKALREAHERAALRRRMLAPEEIAAKAAKLARKAERREIRAIRKRRRAERAANLVSASIQSAEFAPRNPENVTVSHESSRFGLQIPRGGTGVAVQKEFVPKLEAESAKTVTCVDDLSRRRAYEQSIRGPRQPLPFPMSKEDRREEMRRAAAKLQKDRNERIRMVETERARHDVEDELERNSVAKLRASSHVAARFARSALDSRHSSTVGRRMQQQRAQAAEDSARY